MLMNEIINDRQLVAELMTNDVVMPIATMYRMIHNKSGRFKRPPKTFLNYDQIAIYKFESKRLIPIVKKDFRLRQSVRLLEQLSAYFDKFHGQNSDRP